MIRWILALSTICLPTKREPTRSDNIDREYKLENGNVKIGKKY